MLVAVVEAAKALPPGRAFDLPAEMNADNAYVSAHGGYVMGNVFGSFLETP
jgi:hypothetical protein